MIGGRGSCRRVGDATRGFDTVDQSCQRSIRGDRPGQAETVDDAMGAKYAMPPWKDQNPRQRELLIDKHPHVIGQG